MIKAMDDDVREKERKGLQERVRFTESFETLRFRSAELVAALDAANPHIDAAAVLMHVHGFNYTGPTFGVELEALRACLASSPQEPSC